jgi:limonene-1,2-epoxide hydrolase
MTNTEIVNRFIAAWEALDVETIMATFAEGATYHNIPMPPMKGHAQIRRFIEPFLANAESAAFEILHSAENDSGTVMNERVDTFVLKNGQKLVIQVVGIFEMAGGKITKWRDYFDMKAFEAQSAT